MGGGSSGELGGSREQAGSRGRGKLVGSVWGGGIGGRARSVWA